VKRIEWKLKALKQIRKIKDQKTRNIIYDAADALKSFPNCSNIKKLKTRNEYRFRVGNWRIFFTDSIKILYIEEVKKRNERTY
jgi:mRNA-degrading endonuclease RelE of RelBE toxin-antitoxin system